jgi:hypothetical protein
MKRKTGATILAVFFWAMMVVISPSPLPASDTITIVGEVNDSNQIVADGVIYEVDDTPQGYELLTNYMSRRVEVTGSLRIDGDMRILAVKLFKLVKE